MMQRIILACLLVTPQLLWAEPPNEYVKKGNRRDSIRATLKANKLPNLEGKWYWVGPFDNTDNNGLAAEYAPEKELKLDAKYQGKGNAALQWKEFPQMKLGTVVNLKQIIPKSNDTVVYLYQEIEITGDEPELMPLQLGSDDGIAVWLNGKRLLQENAVRPAAPDQNSCELALKPGKNQLLIKISNVAGDFSVYVHPELTKSIPAVVKNQLRRDFPDGNSSAVNSSAEAKHYRMSTIPLPEDCVLEVGGLAFRPDGKLLACTRRGEIWLIHNPTAADPNDVKMTLFASGLHESLGIHVVDNNKVYVVQRPEMTLLTDKDGNGTADDFKTICDKWGNAGDYHEFAFGPAVDKDGNFFITLNVGFGGGHQGKSPYRGWCVKVSPDGKMEPYAYGLRSPNGVNFSPDGDLFYCDNQGEWVASNKMHHIRKGEFYGHQASLPWLKHTKFYDEKKKNDQVASGMMYDGTPTKKDGPVTFPELTPPCIWFPYGRMGQSVTEPRWDTTGGKFGPFSGQCLVGDQTKSMIMRVDLQKIGDTYQGACFPFRSGFQCGVNRLVFAPDGSLFAGQTNRGWGSLGGKPFGLQRLEYTGELPFEILTMKLTKTGYALRFTKPIDPTIAKELKAYSMQSYTYKYFSNYGCPEMDRRAEKVTAVTVDADNLGVQITVPDLHKGRVRNASRRHYYQRRRATVARRRLLHPE
ncbi:MAG: hypothetical protein R3B84_18360 [Zavarzinella sp.]